MLWSTVHLAMDITVMEGMVVTMDTEAMDMASAQLQLNLVMKRDQLSLVTDITAAMEVMVTMGVTVVMDMASAQL